MKKQIELTIRRKHHPVLLFIFLAGIFLFVLCEISLAQETPHIGDYPKTVDPWEVILYEHPNYAGMWIRYKMEPGMRQKLVPQIHPEINDKVSSIQVGSMVRVTGFENRSFGMSGHKVWFSTKESVSKLDGEEELNDMISSLIIYPAASRLIGVWLYDSDSNQPKSQGTLTFLPLPEQENVNEIEYPDLSQLSLEDNVNRLLGDYLSIEVTLFEERNFKGTKLTLPGARGWENQNVGLRAFVSHLDYFGWADRASSIRVRWTGSPLNLGPPKSPKAEVPSVIDLAGTWQSSIGAVYEIKQEGNQFTWFTENFNQTGQGYINEKNVSASWSNKEETGSAIGKITKTDAQGRATEIQWNNGVIFFRQ